MHESCSYKLNYASIPILIIDDENDMVIEMYFVTDGVIGVGYSLNKTGIKDDQV